MSTFCNPEPSTNSRGDLTEVRFAGAAVDRSGGRLASDSMPPRVLGPASCFLCSAAACTWRHLATQEAASVPALLRYVSASELPWRGCRLSLALAWSIASAGPSVCGMARVIAACLQPIAPLPQPQLRRGGKHTVSDLTGRVPSPPACFSAAVVGALPRATRSRAVEQSISAW